MHLPIDVSSIKGFLDPTEGRALFDFALTQASRGPCLEIGSYCGKSTVYLGTACQRRGGVLFSIDHHRGSEENQPGQLYHDPELFDPASGLMDTLPALRETLRRAGLERVVIPIVAASEQIAPLWGTPLSLVFIDGGHTMDAALGDYRAWTPHLQPGGILAIHDVFPDPNDGGRPPFEIYCLARKSGAFQDLGTVKSLALLRRL